ncbi:MAG: DUF1194 domain-containing protein [Alphaproteobacteria bacterium]
MKVMMRLRILLLAAIWLAGAAVGGLAHETAHPGPALPLDAAGSSRVDANLITGVDVSGSISPLERLTQHLAIAAAVTHPDFIERIRLGRFGRVGFTVYAWSDAGATQVIVPWALIGSEEQAHAVSQILANAEIGFRGGLTDAGNAIRDAVRLLNASPFVAAHNVINLVTDGYPNGDSDPARMRDVVVGKGITLNALILPGELGLVDYYRTEVVGGSASFALDVASEDDFLAAFLHKFLLDIASLR